MDLKVFGVSVVWNGLELRDIREVGRRKENGKCDITVLIKISLIKINEKK